MRKAWSEEEKESLYKAVLPFRHDIKGFPYLDPSNHIVDEIRRRHSAFNIRDSKAILYQLKDMGFVKTRKDSHQTGRFIPKKISEMDFHTYKVRPSRITLSPLEKTAVTSLFELYKATSSDIGLLCRKIAKDLSISPTRVKIDLIDQNLIKCTRLLIYEIIQSDSMKGQKSMHSKEISPELKSKINKERRSIAGLYNGHDANSPCFIASNDGTGTGKSYSVIDQFLAHTPPFEGESKAGNFRNLLFISPLKSQFNFSEDHIQSAKDKSIPILPILGRVDMADPDFKDWITGEKNEDKFRRWSKDVKDGQIGRQLQQLRSCAKNISFYREQREYAFSKEQKDELEDMELKTLDRIHKVQKSIVMLILRLRDGDYADLEEDQSTNGEPLDKIIKENGTRKDSRYSDKTRKTEETDNRRFIRSSEYFSGKTKRDRLFSEIIDHVLPFERATYQPTILLATSAKFDSTVFDVEMSKNGGIIKTVLFDNLIGHKIKDYTPVNAMNGKSFEEQVEFLKDTYYALDENNRFRQLNISFTVVIDEEHVAYESFFASSKKSLFHKKMQIAHIFSVIHRISKTIEGVSEDETKSFVLFEEQKALVDDINNFFNSHCSISPGLTLNGILEIFSNNVRHIAIESEEVEQVIQICKNVFSVTPKRFFNENALKKVRIGSFANNTECRIYYEKGGDDRNPTMYDVLQVLLCVFAGCSKIKSNDLRKMLQHGDEYSHNSLLVKFIAKALATRANIEAMFDRTDDDELFIDSFYTYFTPKLIFSIEKINDLEFYDEKLRDKVYVSFRLEMFQELPEAALLRLLSGTNNVAIGLSATTGFRGNYSGGYSRSMFQLFGGEGSENLGFGLIQREDKDKDSLKLIRDLRAESRGVQIFEYEDTEKNHIKKSRENPDFKKVYDFWQRELERFLPEKDKFSKTEFRRQLEGLLLASYEKKNTFILSISNRFCRVMNGYLASPAGRMVRGLKVLSEETHKIFEFSPFESGARLRVIIYDAALAKLFPDLDEAFTLSDDEMKIVLISSFNSAGTGLNLYVKHKCGFEEDFERLILAGSPFYSSILGKDGLNSVENFVLLLKHYANSRTLVQVKDFEVNLINSENHRILMAEHNMAILKEIMQAVGRVERRDTKITTEIYIPSDLLDQISVQMNRLRADPFEKTIKSFSLLNTRLLEFCEDRLRSSSFNDDVKREEFEESVRDSYDQIDSFLGNYLTRRIKEAREGDASGIVLNEAFRSIDCVLNVSRWIETLLSLPEIKENPYLSHVISLMYIRLVDNDRNIRLSRKRGDHKTLTDMAHGDSLYLPWEQILPRYVHSLKGSDDEIKSMLNRVMSFDSEATPGMIPHPAMIPLFKGNVGECIFKDVLMHMNIAAMETSELLITLGYEAYELFDFFVRKDEKIYCIDVKNWTAYFDKSRLSLETHEKALKKRETVRRLCEKGGDLTPSFIYINTHPNLNAMNHKQEFDFGEPIHYMNLFKTVSGYHENRDQREFKTSLRQKLEINKSLCRLLKGKA